MFSAASRIFEIPVWLATLPHRQVFAGAYVERAFSTLTAFDNEVRLRLGVNDIPRRAAFRDKAPLFDLELDLAGRSDIFYDMFHLNALGGEVVAQSLITCGLANQLRTAIEANEELDKVT
jgi:hypothetical protein